jgi:hypothetical protein
MKSRGLEDAVEKEKAAGRKKTRRNREGKMMKEASNFIGTVITRATQRTVRFIRWLRTALYSKAPLSESLALLIRAWWCPKK